MAYKVIFCDLDETLLGKDYIICEENKKAIEKAMQKGLKFIPCTGRGHHSIISVLKDLNLYEATNEFSVSYNGGMIVENKGFKEIMYNGIDFTLIKSMFEAGLKYDVCIEVFTDNQCYVFNINDDELELKKRKKAKFEIVSKNNMDFLINERILKIIFENTDVTYLNKIEKDLVRLTNHELEVSYSSNRYIEFNRIGVNKGSGMTYLCHHLGISMDEVIAIGDNLNDLSMIALAGLGCVVNDGKEELKQISDYICKRKYSEGAVAEVIEKFVLG